MLDFNFFSLIEAHKIHFHNGGLKKPLNNKMNEDLPWHFYARPDLKPDFPLPPWVQSHIKKNNHKKDSDPIGYILFVPQQKKNVIKVDKKNILHIHFSFSAHLAKNMPAKQAERALHSPVAEDKSNLHLDRDHRLKPNWQNFIFLEEGARLTLIESFDLSKEWIYPVCFTTYVQSESRSALNWLTVNQGAPNSSLTCETHGDIKSQAGIHKMSLALSQGISKEFVTLRHVQEKAHSSLLSLALLKQKAIREQKWDTKLLESEGYCRQYFKSILNDKAKNHFSGKVYLSPQSTQSDCVQSAKSFLLSAQAKSLMRPEMEVHCGEVKARHSSTTQQLNLDEMFYLQSRGLQKAKAFEMLIMAHIKDILGMFPESDIGDKFLWDIQNNKKKYLNLLTDP